MGNVYFCATDFYLQGGYVPYSDWFKLAELSGYPVIPLSQLEPESDNCYIVTPYNGEWQGGWPNAKATIYHYELEYREQKEQPPGVAEVWCGDKWYADKLGMRYVPIGSHPGLNVYESPLPDYDAHKMYDVALMMYRAPHRREKIINEMKDLGLLLAPDAWGVGRSASLLISKCMVAIHQWDKYPCVAPLRMCIAAAHKLAVISEGVVDSGIFSGLMPILNYADLAWGVNHTITHENNLTELGQQLYQKLCVDYTFRKSIEAAL